jgi:hypothetical protein
MLRTICVEAQANGDGRLVDTLQFQDPPDRTRRLESVNTLWAEILSKPSTVIADLINTVDRALTLNGGPAAAGETRGRKVRKSPEQDGLHRKLEKASFCVGEAEQGRRSIVQQIPFSDDKQTEASCTPAIAPFFPLK